MVLPSLGTILHPSFTAALIQTTVENPGKSLDAEPVAMKLHLCHPSQWVVSTFTQNPNDSWLMGHVLEQTNIVLCEKKQLVQQSQLFLTWFLPSQILNKKHNHKSCS